MKRPTPHPSHTDFPKRRDPRSVWAIFCALVCVLSMGIMAAGLASAQSPNSLKGNAVAQGNPRVKIDSSNRSLDFMRVYVPADQPEKWPRSDGRYLPMESGTFFQRIHRFNTDHLRPQPEISRAEYRARLDEQFLLRGEADLEISFPPSDPSKTVSPAANNRTEISSSKTSASTISIFSSLDSRFWGTDDETAKLLDAAKILSLPQLSNEDSEKPTDEPTSSVLKRGPPLRRLVLEPFQLALEKLPLESGPNSETLEAENRDPNSGKSFFLGRDAGGQMTMLVSRPGPYRLRWNLVPESSSETTLTYRFRVPRSPRTTLKLDLPSPWHPKLETGMLVEKTEKQSSDRQTWEILLIDNDFLLRFVRGETSENEMEEPLGLRQTVLYDFSRKGIEVRSELQWDENQTPPSRLKIALDAPLVLLKAEYGETALRWSKLPESTDQQMTVELLLPEMPKPTPDRVRLVALAPLVIEKPWQLPRLIPEKKYWRQAKATLLIPSTLRLNPIRELGCRQTKTAALPSPRHGEMIDLQYFTPDATLDVILSEPKEPIQIDYANQVEISGVGFASIYNGVFRSHDRERFKIQADLAPEWIIDSVDSVPTGKVDDWRIEPGTRLLKVRLAHALKPEGDPLRLSIHARRLQSPLGRKLTHVELLPLVWHEGHFGNRLLAVRPAEGYQLSIVGNLAAAKRQPQELDPETRQLLSTRIQNSTLIEERSSDALTFELRQQRPGYSGAIHVDMAIAGKTLLESYRFLCRPKSSPVDRILVHFSHNDPVPFRWTLHADEILPLTARKLSEKQRKTLGLATEGQTWEVTLTPSRELPFEIRANRTVAFEQPKPACLATLPEAHSQQADLTIRTLEGAEVQIENRRLEPVPPPPSSPDAPPTARAAFRFDPNRVATSSTTAVLLSPSDMAGASRLMAWQCRLQSCHLPEGGVRYRANYFLENRGAKRLHITSNESVKIRRILLDGIPVTSQENTRNGATESTHLPATPSGSNCLSEDKTNRADPSSSTETATNSTPGKAAPLIIDLPSMRRFPILTIEYTGSGNPLGVLLNVEPTFLKVDFPVACRYWTAWFPSDYELLREDANRQTVVLPARPWTKRLFGPLGRDTSQTRFNPFSVSSLSKAIPWFTGTSKTATPVEAILSDFSKVILPQQRTPGSPITWRDLMQRLESVSGRVLLLDQIALAERGARPESLVSLPRYSSVEVEAWLESLNLRLLVDEKIVLLTDVHRATLVHAQTKTIRGHTSKQLLTGPLQAQLHQVATGVPNTTYVRPSQWFGRSASVDFPWNRPAEDTLGPDDLRGWIAVETDQSEKSLGKITMVRRPFTQSLRWLALFGTFALGVGRKLGGARQILWISFLAAIGAIWLPAHASPFASGIFLGTLFAWGFQQLFQKRSEESPSKESESSLSQSNASVSTEPTPKTRLWIPFLVALALLSGRESLAQPNSTNHDSTSRRLETVPFSPGAATDRTLSSTLSLEKNNGKSASAEKDRPYRVLIPIDQNRNPISGKVFVPETFLRRLDTLFLAEGRQTVGWIIEEAIYRTRLSDTIGPEEPIVESVRAIYWIRVLEPIGSIRFPLSREEVRLANPTAQLDGKPFHPSWASDGTKILVPVSGQGRYRLELLLTPAPPKEDILTGAKNHTPDDFSMAIPRVARSRLEAELPDTFTEIDVPSAMGATKIESGVLQSDLGPTDRLSLRRRYHTAPGGLTESTEVEELLWLTITPGSVTLKVRLHFHLGATLRAPSYEIHLDPKLRLLQPPRGGTLKPIVGAPHVQQLLLNPSKDEPAPTTFEADFLLEQTPGVGRLELPEFRIEKVRLPRRRLAVTIDPTLKYEAESEDFFEPFDVTRFLEEWNETHSTEPTFALLFSRAHPNWSISTSPRPSKTAVDRSLLVGLHKNRAKIDFNANLTTTASPRFRYRLIVPESLVVDSISLVKDGLDRLSRMARTEPERLDLFLDGPVEGTMRLSLEGHLPLEMNQPLDLKTIRVENSRCESSEVVLRRSPDILVDLERTEGLKKVEPVILGPQTTDDWSRPVAAYEAKNEGDSSLRLTVRPNRPKVEADQLVSVFREKEAWRIQTDFKVTPLEGAVDEIRLRVPGHLVGPFRFHPPMKFIKEESTSDHEILVLRPARSLQSVFQFTMEGYLTEDRAGVPDIVPLGMTLRNRFVALPDRWHNLPLRWDIRGLKRLPAPLPEQVTALLKQPLSAQRSVYTVETSSFHAVCNLLQPLDGAPIIRFADLHLRWQSDLGCFGVAVYDIEPSGQSWIPLYIPARFDLIRLSLEGVTTVPVPQKISLHQKATATQTGRRYQVPLVSRTLPQRMVIVFSGEVGRSETDDSLRFDVPKPTEATFTNTFWHLHGPPSLVPEFEAMSRGTRTTNLEFHLKHASTITEILASLGQQGTASQNETKHAISIWAARLMDQCERLENELPRAPKSDSTDALRVEEARSSSERWKKWYASKATPAILNEISATWSEGPLSDPQRTYLISTEDPIGPLALPWKKNKASDHLTDSNGSNFFGYLSSRFPFTILPESMRHQLDLVFVFALLGVTLFMAGRWRGGWRPILQRPYLIGILLGGLWWLLLRPDWCGLVFAILCLIFHQIGRKKQKPSKSVIIPLE